MAKKAQKPQKTVIADKQPKAEKTVSKHLPKRTPIQRLHDLEIIAELTLRGVKQSIIAARLGLSQQAISRDLKDVRKKWLERANINYDANVSEQIAKLDLLEEKYWEGWESSKQPRKNSLVAVRENTKAALSEKEAKEETRDGDPRFLQGVLLVVERRSKLLGLDKPTKIQGKLEMLDIRTLTDEQIDQLADGEKTLGELFHQPNNRDTASDGNSGKRTPKKAATQATTKAAHRRKRS